MTKHPKPILALSLLLSAATCSSCGALSKLNPLKWYRVPITVQPRLEKRSREHSRTSLETSKGAIVVQFDGTIKPTR